ncbi:hypothetical protein [Neptuniibacter sp. QD37_11]|uniref:hypothetical protein n=1 Tax=Neptuniibacter sp. QD37_11 TaxID=3398209 RepID=UPI0039F4A31E
MAVQYDGQSYSYIDVMDCQRILLSDKDGRRAVVHFNIYTQENPSEQPTSASVDLHFKKGITIITVKDNLGEPYVFKVDNVHAAEIVAFLQSAILADLHI